MHDIFAMNTVEAVLHVDAENTFNYIDKHVLLHGINHIRPYLSLVVIMSYHLMKVSHRET